MSSMAMKKKVKDKRNERERAHTREKERESESYEEQLMAVVRVLCMNYACYFEMWKRGELFVLLP